jgi:transcriptional regulator with XRE-family HTH domain
MASYTGTDSTRLSELGAFLKSRRARVTPDDVGIAHGFRRRTPGLRREEVSQLAGVGLTWYTWLEQGRDIHVSSQVLCTIARALRLEPAERVHLFRLAGHEPPAGFAEEGIRPAHLRVLAQWEPFPAFITGWRWDVLAWNRPAAAVFGDYGELPDGRRNLLWSMFAVRERRGLYEDWEGEARKMVAKFRSEAASYLDEPAARVLVAELQAESPEFATLWERRDVHARTDGRKRLTHPTLGLLELEHTSYHVSDQPGVRLSLFAPVLGERTDHVLRDLDLSAARSHP